MVGEPETECPGACAWPFHASDYAKGAILRPPNGNIGADAMVVALASGLAETVTNPLNTGFYGGIPTRPVEASCACPQMFGTGSTPGNAGKVLIDRVTGGAYNAFGARGRKFLLPGLWDPKACACWTLL